MASKLSTSLVDEFVKAISSNNDNEKSSSTLKGTVKIVDGSMFVMLDGSDILTPANTTVAAKDGNRVEVRISDHSATITGNLSDVSVGENTAKSIVDGALNGFVITNSNFIDGTISGSIFKDGSITGTKIADSTIESSHISQSTFDKLTGDTIVAVEGQLENLVADNATIKKLETEVAKIENVTAEEITASTGYISDLKANNVTTESIKSSTGYIDDLISNNITTDKIISNSGYIGELESKEITADKINSAVILSQNIETDYAKIDFTNVDTAHINQAWIQELMVQGKIIAQEGTIYYLDAVHINADSITAGTMKADRLLLSGENGLFYEINATIDGITATELSSEEYQNQIHGDVIIAKSITADKINVADLQALNATIGGWVIKSDSIYSGTKSEFKKEDSVGTYLGSDGKIDIGSNKEYVRFDPTTGELEISSNNISLKSVDLVGTLDDINDRISENSTSITQTSNKVEIGFTQIDNKLEESDQSWEELRSYIRFVDGNIELGRSGNNIKTVLTNNEFAFIENGAKVAFINENKLYISRAQILDTLYFDHWSWTQRSNGNISLRWRG